MKLEYALTGILGYKLLTLADHFEVDAVPYEDEPNPNTLVWGGRTWLAIGVAPAINNALYNAIGANCNDCPITPDIKYYYLVRCRRMEDEKRNSRLHDVVFGFNQNKGNLKSS